MRTALLVAILLGAAAAARAAEKPSAAPEAPEDGRAFYHRMKGYRADFDASQRKARKEFEGTLAGKAPEARRRLRIAFDKAESDRHDEFEALQKKRWRQYYDSKRGRSRTSEEER